MSFAHGKRNNVICLGNSFVTIQPNDFLHLAKALAVYLHLPICSREQIYPQTMASVRHFDFHFGRPKPQ
jgi:hypothetical protein